MINKEQPNRVRVVGDAFDTRDLRQALSAFGTGVTVVTTLDADARPVGVTANSFNSVSLEPPIVLWSLRKASPSLPAFDACGRFVINVLTLDQVPISQRFASRLGEKFAGLEFDSGVGGVPLLAGCCARFQCRNTVRHAGGDHVVFISEVVDFDRAEERLPLLYFGGAYRKLRA